MLDTLFCVARKDTKKHKLLFIFTARRHKETECKTLSVLCCVL